MRNPLFILTFIFLTFIACSENDDTDADDSVNTTDDVVDNTDDSESGDDDNGSTDADFTFEAGLTFDWRLDELPDNFTTDVDVIDIDAFDATPALVANLQAQGVKVIAYLSVGSVENFREDADQFPESVIGNIYEGFEDENWLDVREIDLIAPIMRARLDMIRSKGFDAIEPDNINGYQNNTGFSLTQQDAIDFSNWLIEESHSRGLSIGQKNAEEIIPDLVDSYDWILSEDAFVDDFGDTLEPYITAGKAVFLTEYTDSITENNFLAQVCPYATEKGYSAVLKNRDLTDTTVFCN